MNASIAVPGRAERPLPASRQRGAIGLFGILTLLTGLLFTALAVDAGRLWMERRQLQSIADMAALEAAGTIGCAANLADVQAAAQAAAPVPNSLTDIAGGRSAGTSRDEALAHMEGFELLQNMDSMSREQMEAWLNNL